MCFVDTIDWSRITNSTEEKDNIIVNNQAANECPICPSGKKSEGTGDGDHIELPCPSSKRDPNQKLCWNRQHCQKSMFLFCLIKKNHFNKV